MDPSYLHNRIQQVGVQGEHSSTTAVSGVPQGSVLGPLLFLIYTDGLSGINLSGGSIVLFADDLLLHHLITSIEDFQRVQNDIDKLFNWLSFYKLSLNPSKCKAMLISRKKLPTVSPSLHVNGSVLQSVSSYRAWKCEHSSVHEISPPLSAQTLGCLACISDFLSIS